MFNNKPYTYKTGDVVKVWSLQSFFGGGFLKGEPAIVRQNQIGDSVILIVTRKPSYNSINKRFKYLYVLDTSYEVYQRQTELVKKATLEDKKDVEEFLRINAIIRERENKELNSGDNPTYISESYAPEFFIGEDLKINLNKDLLAYPELFV